MPARKKAKNTKSTTARAKVAKKKASKKRTAEAKTGAASTQKRRTGKPRPGAPRTRAGLASARGASGAANDPQAVLAWLERSSSKSVRDGMARYGLPADHALGVSVGALKQHAKKLGRDHELATALWSSGVYEARLLASFVGDPALLTSGQMDAWCKDFDNWGVVDTACFALFDRSPHAWSKVEAWAGLRDEFGKRAGFVMLACLALHDKEAADERFLRFLPLIERAASDERNFVKKGVSWALRAIGARSPALHAASIALAERLAESEQPAERWLGKDALRDLGRPLVTRRLASRRGAAARS